MKYKVSIIIPCFNESQYLSNCLETLSKQSLMPDEVIICDNASTDGTIKIAKKFHKKLPLKIISQPIKGIIPTVEKAWRQSIGDIVVRTDADARFPKDWLEKLISHFYTDPDLKAAGGNWDSWDGGLFAKYLMKIAFPVGDIFFPLFRGFKLLVGPNMAFRRTSLQKINGFILDNSDLPEDQLISFKFHQAGLKYKRFYDCGNYHSSRSWNRSFSSFLRYIYSSVNPKFYPEKSN